MPVNIKRPLARALTNPEVLNQNSFAAFGTVIANPAPTLVPSHNATNIPPNAVQANQGSALKYLDVTDMEDLYASAPSKVPSKAVINMFVCAPRSLLTSSEPHVEGYFHIEILERHPYTTQTFIPLGISPSEARQARYLVVVAPSLPPTRDDKDLPVPSVSAGRAALPGRGLPDLSKVKAFIANGGQAVTYGAGTWHAPMAVVGSKPIDFVVVQFANGVAIEDCQEVELGYDEQSGLSVIVPVYPQTPYKL